MEKNLNNIVESCHFFKHDMDETETTSIQYDGTFLEETVYDKKNNVKYFSSIKNATRLDFEERLKQYKEKNKGMYTTSQGFYRGALK